jgi:catechol 2,3-dioxygenase-like lactoylglutathione lyase family enzyme
LTRLLAFLGGLLLVTPLAFGASGVDAVERIVIPVLRLEQAAAFYTGALNFVPVENAAEKHVLRLGSETIEHVQGYGRTIPAGSRSNDGWFQHLAIVVSDIDAAYARVLQAGAVPISAGAQSLPEWNPNAGGIRAVYFRDPDGHPLELIRQGRPTLAGQEPPVPRHRPPDAARWPTDAARHHPERFVG